MKKFTLMVAAALVSMGAAAQTVQSLVPAELKASFQQQMEMKNVGLSPYNMKTLAVDPAQQAQNAALLNMLRENANHKNLPKLTAAALMKQGGVQKADAVDQYGYYSGYRFSNLLGGSAPFYMWGGFYTVDGSEIQLDPYGFDYMKGEILKGNNSFSSMGADSISFKSGQVVAKDKSGNEYAIYMGSVGENADQTYVLNRSNDPIGGYYFPESGEIYIPYFFALFPVNGTEFLDGTAIGGLDMLNANKILEAAYLSKVTALTSPSKSYPEGEIIEEDSCVAVSFGNSLAISGMSYQDPSSFLNVVVSEDGASAAVENYQYVNTFGLNESVGGGSLEIYEAAFTPSGDRFQYYQNGFGMFIGQDENDNIILESDGSSYLCELGFSDNEEYDGYLYGVYTAMVVEITPVTLIEAGIDGVTENKGDVVATEYFDMLGRKADKAHGLVVKKMRYADGSVKSVKVVK